MTGPSLSNLVRELEELVRLEAYGVTASLEGSRLIVTALKEGALNTYLYTEEGLIRLNREPISLIAEPPWDASRVIVGRDVAKGREQHALYYVPLDSPGDERELAPGLEPGRVLSLVDQGERVYVTRVFDDGIWVVEATPGSSWRRVGPLPGMGWLADAHRGWGAVQVFTPEGRIRLMLMDLAAGELSDVAAPEGSVIAVRFSPQGELVYALEKADGVELRRAAPGEGDLGLMELPGKDLDEYRPMGVNYMRFDERGRLIVVAKREGASQVFLDGWRVPGPRGVYSNAHPYGDGELVASYSSLRAPPQVVVLDGEGHRVLLSSRLPPALEEALGEPEFHWVESVDARRVPVIVLPSWRARRPGPAVVLVHGGPFSEDDDSWSVFAAALALLGFHVVMPNYRGSTGYGEEWRNLILGDVCGMELEDIVSAARWARSTGLAAYTVVMGYSYGGFATMCALTRKPEEFAAGVAGASVVDWEEMYELSDPAFRSFIDLLFAGDRSKWRERSPINHVDNLSRPLCIIHPQNDTRTPLKPLLRFMDRALEKGKTFEAHIAPDMGHAVNTVEDIEKILLPAALFLARIRERLGA